VDIKVDVAYGLVRSISKTVEQYPFTHDNLHNVRFNIEYKPEVFYRILNQIVEEAKYAIDEIVEIIDLNYKVKELEGKTKST
jgi:hypothetical protein